MSTETEVLDEWMGYPIHDRRLALLAQTTPGHRPGEGAIGDCYRTCIACLLGAREASWVPHFVEQTMHIYERPGWYAFRLARLWLREMGLDLMEVEREVADELGVPYVLSVRSKAGDWQHCVLGREGSVIHDPSGRDGYTMDDAAPDSTVEILVAPYVPDPDEMVRRWELAAAEIPTDAGDHADG